MNGRILIVEDEPGIAESLAFLLSRDGYAPHFAESLAAARQHLAHETVDLIILDLGLPDGNGLDLLRELRQGEQALAVIVLTSREAEVDRVVGLELGADDYVTKPFSPREVVARVKTVLRRVQAPAPSAGVGPAPLRIDLDRRRVFWAEREVSLTKTELDLLAALASRPGQVFGRERLLERVWGDNVVVSDRTVDAHIKSLRRKLRDAGAAADLIETVRGVGYRLGG